MAKKMSRTVVRRHSFFSNLAGPVVLIRWKSWRSLMFWPPYRKKRGIRCSRRRDFYFTSGGLFRNGANLSSRYV